MASSLLAFGSYRRYKEDTTLFLEWLAEKAAASGCILQEVDPPSSSEPKSLAEKLREKAAKKASKREEKRKNQESAKATDARVAETTREVLDLAGAVAKNPKIQVPENILKLVLRAIRTRKLFAEWFSSTKIENGNSDDGHRYFIWILEEALRILSPRMPPKIRGQKSRSKSPINTPSYDMRNRFQPLLSEATEPMIDQDDSEDTKDIGDILERGSNDSSHNQLKSEKRDQGLDHSDAVFKVYCFFQDLHKIQEFLAETWRSYGKQEIDLVTASFTTNAAMDIVRREHQELSSQVFPDKVDVSWPAFIHLISPKKYLGDLYASDSAEFLSTSQHGHFIYANPALYLKRLLLDFRPTPYVGLLPPFQWHYRDHPQLLQLPEAEIFKAEYQFLAKMMLDAHHIAGMKGPQGPVSDELFRGVWGDTKIPDIFTQRLQDWAVGQKHPIDIPMVFASRIMLDIQGILGEKVLHGEKYVKDAIDAARDILKVKSIQPTAPVQPTSMSPEDHALLVETLASYSFLGQAVPVLLVGELEKLHKNLAVEFANHEAAAVALFDTWKCLDFSERRQKLFEYNLLLKDAQLMPISMPTEAFARGRLNPVHCGDKLLELNLKVEQRRLDFANEGMSIFVMAHLYNAARQFGKLGLGFEWPEMDKVINIHLKTLFSGELPDNEEKCENRLGLCLGYKPQMYLRHTEKFRQQLDRLPKFSQVFRANGHEERRLPCSKATPILRSFYKKNEPISMEACLFQLDQQVSKTPSLRSNLRAPDLTVVEFLRRIRDSLPAEIEHMQFDYMEFEKKCAQLLKRIRLTFLVELQYARKEENTETHMGGARATMAVGILAESRHSRATVRQFSKHFEHRDDWKGLQDEEKFRMVKNHMERCKYPIYEQPGTPKQDIVARILRKFVEDEVKASGGGK